MNKSSGNMYQFNKLYTYNALKGICGHMCSYCFMSAMRRRFRQDPTLRLDQKELAQNLGKDRFIFVGSSTDDFAPDVPEEWIVKVLNHLYDYPDNEYMLQSKNPARFLEFVNHKFFRDRKDKLILCTTIESDIDHPGISNAPVMAERIAAMKTLSDIGFQTMVTIEPIMAFTDAVAFADMIASVRPVQVNIGANTVKTVKLLEPAKNEVEALIGELASRGIKVHRKTNLERLLV